MGELPALTRSLGYDFADQALLELALTHKSRGSRNYERLEFLGDSLLGFTVADYLYRRFDTSSEGKLSRMRASVVRRETLAEVARGLELGKYIQMGEGELKSGGYERDSILADTLEALIGAIYLDGGAGPATKLILRHFEPVLEALSTGTNYKDPKSLLQEALQAKGLALPRYEVVETAGSAHRQTFVVECRIDETGESARATGASRREAEQSAASILLELLA
jgi:ribonuclease-3